MCNDAAEVGVDTDRKQTREHEAGDIHRLAAWGSHEMRNEFNSSINTEKRELDILLSLPYTYNVNLQRKYREDEYHGKIW